MRCPKCGAFMEDGKDICIMCGVNVKTYVPNNQNNVGYNTSNNGMFGSGMGDFSNNYNPNMNSNYMQKKEAYNNRKNDYRDVTLQPVKNGEKDIFDFFSENKRIITLFLSLLIIGLVTFIGFKYFQSKSKLVPIEPLIMNLYYEVDDTFKAVSGNYGAQVYSKSGEKGNDCSISISYGTSTTGDHVKEYFKEIKTKLEPEKDNNGNVVDQLDVYTSQDSKIDLNGSSWYYLNIFYKKDSKSDATHLRYKYLTSMYNGYFYDIELVNNSNDALCNASLDNFAKSLKFIEKTEISK